MQSIRAALPVVLRVANHARGLGTVLFRSRMQACDESVASFHRNNRVKHHRRRRIGGRDQCRHNSHWFADLDDSFFPVFANDAELFKSFTGFIDALRSEFVFRFLLLQSLPKPVSSQAICPRCFGICVYLPLLEQFCLLVPGNTCQKGELRFLRLVRSSRTS